MLQARATVSRPTLATTSKAAVTDSKAVEAAMASLARVAVAAMAVVVAAMEAAAVVVVAAMGVVPEAMAVAQVATAVDLVEWTVRILYYICKAQIICLICICCLKLLQ